jgi:cytochrome b561
MNLTSVVTIVEIAVVIAAALIAIWYAIRRLKPLRGVQPREPIAAGAGEVSKYHPLLVILHWSIAFAMAQLLVRGAFIMVNIPNSDPAKVDALRAHMLAGTVVLALMTARLVVRRATRLPPEASPRKPILEKVKHLVWPLLYAGVLSQASVGLAMAFQTDLPGVLFGGHGALPADFWVYPLRSVHYAISRLLVVLIALHTAAPPITR